MSFELFPFQAPEMGEMENAGMMGMMADGWENGGWNDKMTTDNE